MDVPKSEVGSGDEPMHADIRVTLIYRPDLGMSPVDVSYMQDLVDDVNTQQKENRNRMAVLALEDAIRYCREEFGSSTPRWGEVCKEQYGPLEFERFGATRTLGALEEKDHYLLTGVNASGTRTKFRTLYKFVAEIGEDGIEAYSISAHDQGRPEPGSKHFFDQGKLYQQKRFKKTLFYFSDVMANVESDHVLDVH